MGYPEILGSESLFFLFSNLTSRPLNKKKRDSDSKILALFFIFEPDKLAFLLEKRDSLSYPLIFDLPQGQAGHWEKKESLYQLLVIGGLIPILPTLYHLINPPKPFWGFVERGILSLNSFVPMANLAPKRHSPFPRLTSFCWSYIYV